MSEHDETPTVDLDSDLDEVVLADEVSTKIDTKIVPDLTIETEAPLFKEPEVYIEDALDENEPDKRAERLTNDFTPNPHVTMSNSPFAPTKVSVTAEKHLAFLMQGMTELEELAEEYKLDFTSDKQNETLAPKVLRLKSILGELASSLQTAYFRDLDKRPDSDWGQGVQHGELMLRAGKAQLKADADPVLRIRNELGLGGLIQIPLWHSGIWVTLKTPSDAALHELEARMALEKTTLGRASNGLVFSSAEVYTKTHLIDFILEHVYATTAGTKEPGVLKPIILDTDYPQLVWGMALAVYPAGYPLIQPCVANPDTCDHVVEALINLGRISWVDRSQFSTAQKIHMLNRVKTVSIEKIEEYQKEFSAQHRGSVEISANVRLRLRVPSLAESQSIGYDWVESILSNTQKAFGMKMADGAREQYVQQQALITSLRQYSHWFDAVVRTSEGEEEVISNREAVDEIISMVSTSDDIANKVYRLVRDFINQCTLSMIAIPKYKCPACQGEPNEEHLLHPKLIPLDVVQVFFTLRDQKIMGKLVAEMNRAI